ncbi:MAG: 2-oxoacid:acceptor oxidoreductase family protein [Solirubrobacteraceae bacterium]
MTSEAIGVRVAGRGGQGVMLAGFLLAQAAMTDGKHVVQTQSYGPEARLGAAKSDVILSRSEIAYPEVIEPDVFLCLSHDALVAYSSTVSPGAMSIIDDRAVSGFEIPGAIILPLTETARECGAALATNIVGLGALVGTAALVSERSMREALAARVAPDLLALNTQAFTAGLRLAASV